MALTIAVVPDTRESGPQLIHELYDITFDSSYASGGEAVQATDFGLRTLLGLEVVGGNAAAALYHFQFDTTNLKILAAISAGFTPAGTNGTSAVTGTAAAPTFTGAPMTAHRHVLHFQTSAAANAVTAAANALRTAAAAFDVAGVGDSLGEGGVVDVTAGTPVGTNSTSAVTGTAAAQTFTGTARAAAALVEASGNLAALTIRARVYGK